ncbi:MAG: Smr/MutS family protein [Bacteroidaceae bacterium]|nr:Smr/MutS family protein [Bacteroidaceae bacterium]
MLYPKNFEQKIGFNEIRTLLLAHCLSPLGRERVDGMHFLSVPEEVRTAHRQVGELRQMLAEQTEQPPQDFFDLRACIQRIRIEGTYIEEQEMWNLLRALTTLHAWVAIVRQEEDGRQRFPELDHLAEGVFTFHAVTRRIEQILDKYGRIKDDASSELSRIRHELRRSEGSVSQALNRILRAAQAEGLVEKDVAPTLRDGRLVIPVAPAMKRRLKGIVHDESATGKTVFIEPEEVVEANNRIRELEAEEKREIVRILREFTDSLRPNVKELLRGFEFLADIEFLRAKVRFAEQLNAGSPTITQGPLIDWTLARHPLLELSLKGQGKQVVPLEISLHRKQRILLISGPNAGGKSVCLKTVGLLQYMLQCGLPVPMGENSRCGIFSNMFIDIGDEQSIEDDLSTYSGHLLNMRNMMQHCDPASLLLIDEFGGGTEPTIGGAIAESVLKRFVGRGAFAVITTHYQNLKHFAEDTPGVVNGAMLYDRHRMEALFQLQIGHPGSSFAVEIARKTGIPEDVIADATELVGKEYVNADKYLLDITRDKRYWEGKRQTIHSQEKQIQATISQYEQEISELRAKRKEIIRDAKQQAEQIIREANAMVERTIREIREAQAERERTKEVRQEMEDFRRRLEEEEQHEHDAMIEKKMRQIEARRKRKEERRSNNPSSSSQPASQSTNQSSAASTKTTPAESFEKGQSVRIKGQTSVGEVIELQGKQAVVAFGMMRTVVDTARLVAARKPETTQQVAVSYLSRSTQDQMRQRNLNFKQEIDIRGMRGEEAIQAITYYIDDAILVGASRVRILHGTGNGILRQLIRQYLSTVTGVVSAHDEHVQLGGAGITVVELS